MIKRFIEISGKLASDVANVFLPPLCLACHTSLTTHNAVCPKCWSQINFIAPPFCDRLGIPLPYHTEGQMLSTQALTHPPVYDHARSAAYFEGPMRHLIHAFKYADRHEAIDLFARWLQHAGQDVLESADFLLPVPLHYQRLWARRFNQSAFLAKALSGYTGIPHNPFLLKRRKNTQSQVGLTLKQRQSNVSGAFHIDKTQIKLLKGKEIVLVDDVLTSGSTVEACAGVLKKAGANKVNVLTIARVVTPKMLLQ
ncbi:MAG: ComF family protein [Pseudomonadota bacterium]